MKKIAIVAQGLNNGGAERVASILANYLAQKGYEVLFIATYNNEKEYYLDKKIKYVSIQAYNKNKLYKLLERNVKIYCALKNFKIDMVFAFITNELILSEMSGIPIVFSLRNHPNYIDNSFVASRLRQYAYKNAKHVVFQTQGAADFFGDEIKKKSSVIFNPLNIRDFSTWLNKKTHKKIFITAARLCEQKNLSMLIEVFAEFHKKHREYSLEIYGDGELKDQLHDQIKNLEAEKYIKLGGHTVKIHDIMANSTAFILTSNYEGLSNAMLEALAIGVPCVCTDCPPGGARSFIKSGENGFLIPVGDKKSLLEVLNNLVEGNYNLESISKKSIEIREILDADKICYQWEKLI